MQKIFKTPKGTELPLLNMRGKDYLEVKWRIVWFRETHPEWSIETEFTSIGDKHALCRAIVKNDAGRIIATSHKYEDPAGFGDFREKSETGAIGRALALIGFGTQFCADELDEGKRIVDSPVTQKGAIAPDQPEHNDGIADNSYRITFGKFKNRSLEEVGPTELAGYVNYLEKKASEEKKELQGQVLEFIQRAEEYIGAFENQALYPASQ